MKNLYRSLVSFFFILLFSLPAWADVYYPEEDLSGTKPGFWGGVAAALILLSVLVTAIILYVRSNKKGG